MTAEYREGFTLDATDGSTWYCDGCGVELGLEHKPGCHVDAARLAITEES